MAKLTKVQQAEKAEAIERLREVMPPGTTVYTILRHDLHVWQLTTLERGVKTELQGQWDYPVAVVTGSNLAKREGIVVDGAGMDMGFHLVYSLSYDLYPDGFGCVGEKCPSNDHSNGDRDYTPAVGMLSRCPSCLDVPGKDGLGRQCKTCKGSGQVESKHNPKHWHKDGGYALNQKWI